MPSFEVRTPQCVYQAIVERGIIDRLHEFIPAKAGSVFVVTTQDVWQHQGARAEKALADVPHRVLYLPGGEENKRLAPLEALAEQMVRAGGDRSSIVIAFGGGIVNDMGGFLAAMFMRGIPVVQVPTTLLAQVDAAVGGKTGVNLVAGKNLIGAFHQPQAVLIDPGVLDTLPSREYRAGLFEVIKCGVIRSPRLFELLEHRVHDVLRLTHDAVDELISESVRIKAEVVSADEKEGGLRRILNFGHTVGHALEAETAYSRFLHGEAVAFGMKAATRIAELNGILSRADRKQICDLVNRYGPIPPLHGIRAENLLGRLIHDKKTLRGKVHFVLPERIGEVRVVTGVDDDTILSAIRAELL
jgi:3-dehydroquinate synthase